MRNVSFTKKLGMMSFYKEDNTVVPVSVLEIMHANVVKKKSLEVDGYKALVVNYGPNAKEKNLAKSMKGYFSDVKNPKKYLKEIKVSDDLYEKFAIGDEISSDLLDEVKFVDAIGISIGKGFAGVMKRHNFRGLRASHGVSIAHRSQGSTGGCQDPGRVFKGKKMAGHLGCKKVSILNLSIVKIDKEKRVVLVEGAVPGYKGQFVFLRNAIKKSSNI